MLLQRFIFYCDFITLRQLEFPINTSYKKSGTHNVYTLRMPDFILLRIIYNDYLYSSQLFIAISSTVMVQKAWINALAKRALVISGIFKSIAARRIL